MCGCTGNQRYDTIWTRVWVGGHDKEHIIDLSPDLRLNVQSGLALLLNQHIMFDFTVMSARESKSLCESNMFGIPSVSFHFNISAVTSSTLRRSLKVELLSCALSWKRTVKVRVWHWMCI